MIKTEQIAFNAAIKASNIRGFLLIGTPVMLDSYQQAAQENGKLETEFLDSANTEEDRKLITELKALDDQYSQIAEQKVIPMKKAGQDKEAAQLAITQLTPVGQALTKKADEYATYREKRIQETITRTTEDMDYTKTMAVCISLVATLFGILIGFFSARGITRPINSLVNTARQIAAGNLAQQVEIQRNDEIGELQKSFKTMVENLREVVSQVQSNAQQVAAASEELTASAEQSAQASGQVALSITDVAQGAESQLKAADEAVAVVEQMSAGIQQIAANTNMVAATSNKTSNAATKGGKAVDTAINQMNAIEKTVEQSAQVVAKLGERSKEIGQIVDTISSIAGQTNLLALNAAIEAARAGEQGRGFAVVAEEVRKLAEQSQTAAKQIADMIGEIQGDTDQAVAAMEAGTQEVSVGTEVVNGAGMAFKEIVALISQMSSQIHEISTSIQQMADGSQQIVTAVQNINKVSQETSNNTQTVSAATEEQSASMEEIASSSETLAKMADDLQGAVQRFVL